MPVGHQSASTYKPSKVTAPKSANQIARARLVFIWPGHYGSRSSARKFPLWEQARLRLTSRSPAQVVRLAPQITRKWKADTMKPCILRDPNSVEPQKPALCG